MNVTDLMSWEYEGYTTLKVVWIAFSKAFSNFSNDVNALGKSNLKKLSRKYNPTLIGLVGKTYPPQQKILNLRRPSDPLPRI